MISESSLEKYQPIFADIHVHPVLDDWNRQSPISLGAEGLYSLVQSKMNLTHVDWAKCHDLGINMMCVAHFNPFDEFATMPTDLNSDAPRNTFRMCDQLESEIETKYSRFAKVVHSREELESEVLSDKPHGDRRIAVVHTLEGGHALGGNLSMIEQFARRGIAMMTLTHFFYKGICSSANSIPFFPDAGAKGATVGLSAYGHEVVQEMELQGIIVDITHATGQAIADILRVATRPLVASHAAAQTLGNHPYSMKDEHIQALAGKGGLIGIVVMPYWLSNYSDVHQSTQKGTLQEVVRTAQYIYKITGNHTCIGIASDFGGFIIGPKDVSAMSQIVELRRLLMREFTKSQVDDRVHVKSCVNWYFKQRPFRSDFSLL